MIAGCIEMWCQFGKTFAAKMEAARRRGSWLTQAVIFTAAVVVYRNALNCGFVFDDVSAVKDNKDLRPYTPIRNLVFNDFWGTPLQKEQSHKSYRPLCVLTFRWNYAVHELDPVGYHLVNVILHGIVCVFYFRMCSMFLPEIASFVAAMLFAVHPIHTEAVTGVVGRAELLSSIFFLAAFAAYTRCAKSRWKLKEWWYLAWTVVLVAAAMLSKEQGITVIGICAVYEFLVVQKISLREVLGAGNGILNGKFSIPARLGSAMVRTTVLLSGAVMLLLSRVMIMGSQLPVFTRFDNPAAASPSPTRQLTYNYLLSLNFWLLLFPCDLCCDWTMGTVPLVTSFADWRNLATIAFYLGLLRAVWWILSLDSCQRRDVITMALALIVLPFLPASNLFFPVGFVVAERILYMPSMGFCMLVAYGWTEIWKQSRTAKKIAWLALAAILLLHGTKTYQRNFDWESEYSIFMSGLKVNRRNAKLYNNVGHAHETQGNYTQALMYFQQAVAVQNDDVGAHINVGRTYNNLKRFDKAEEAYLMAKSLLPKPKPGESYQTRIAPNHLSVFLNLATLISRNRTRLEEADRLYQQAIAMRHDYTQAYINRGDILIKMNRTREAQEVYERALFYDSNNPDIYYNLGVVFLEQGKALQALAYLDKALEFDPDHTQALMNSAILIQETGIKHLRTTASDRLMKLLAKDDRNERVFFNLGMLAMDDGDIAVAESWFRRAVDVREDFRSALFNLALLLSEALRPLEAVPFLNQLLKYHPDHIKGLILLGDIYINHMKDLDAAEKCYERILQRDPMNVQGQHNLCVVHVERGDLARAETCFVQAHEMAPEEGYILKHLQIVRSRLYGPPSKEQTSTPEDSASSSPSSSETASRPSEHPPASVPAAAEATKGHCSSLSGDIPSSCRKESP